MNGLGKAAEPRACPPWSELLAYRLDPQAAEPAPGRWLEALEHLDRCAECKRRAVLADPTLVFDWASREGAPDVDGTDAGLGEDFAEEMKVGVRTLRRGRALEEGLENAPQRTRRTSRQRSWARRSAIAAALVAGLALGFGTLTPESAPDDLGESSAPMAESASLPQVGSPALSEVSTLPAGSLVTFSHLEELNAPVVEAVANPNVRVYRVPPPPNRKIDIVMVIDPAVDV